MAAELSDTNEYEELLQSGDASVQAAYEKGLDLSLGEVLSLARSWPIDTTNPLVG